MNELVVSKRHSKIFRELNAIMTIMSRDITLIIKSPAAIIISLAFPIIMMGMLGGNLSQNMASGLGFSYNRFMMVGMLINMLFMGTVMQMTSLVDDHETDFTQEMLVSPVSRYSIVIGKIFGSMFIAIVNMIGTLAVGLAMGITLSWVQLLLLLILSPLMCLSAGAISMLIIGLIKNKKTANTAVMLIVMPQMFLSGAIIPINHSSGILYVLNHLMPMTYCLDLARAVIYAGTNEYAKVVMFNPIINFITIAVLTIVFLVIGTISFARSEKNK